MSLNVGIELPSGSRCDRQKEKGEITKNMYIYLNSHFFKKNIFILSKVSILPILLDKYFKTIFIVEIY